MTASPDSSSIVNPIQLKDTSIEEDFPDREIVERTRTPDLGTYNTLFEEQRDDHTECIKPHSPPTTTPLPLGSEDEMIDESIIENPPSQTLYTLAVENTDGSGNETSGSSGTHIRKAQAHPGGS
ncbi:hypothetical protein N7471_010677 [Penicillium samsonianum]|uniref:uncharacterized protein n=1 Tax=Penicillium samsonianum TaxID=1882272 RepID=UPI0025484D41|nr:uncharacterized protein N7471_010677 [Penicillium samsonianum]KAJ6126184.1 hypothetical protein N7471_010677 [Penicillium samsonianum]